MNNTLYLFTGDFMSLTNELILHLKSENTKIVLLVHHFNHMTKQDYIYIETKYENCKIINSRSYEGNQKRSIRTVDVIPVQWLGI